MIRLMMTLFLGTATACATLPKAGTVEPTGEMLAVDGRTQTYQYVSKDKVGEVETKDSAGNTVARSDVYENRTHTAEKFTWYPRQGAIKLEDENFFRIAGDLETAEEIHHSRENGVLMNHIGLGLLAAGVAVALGGYAMDTSHDSGVASAGTLALSLSSVMLGGGGFLTWFGIAKANAEHPVNDYDRAEAAAQTYNSHLRPTAFRPAPGERPSKQHRRDISTAEASP